MIPFHYLSKKRGYCIAGVNICMSFCLSFCLSVCPSVCLSVYIYVRCPMSHHNFVKILFDCFKTLYDVARYDI